MKGVVIYKGKYGATRQYAQWVGEELNFPVLKTSEAEQKQIKDADLVILGTSVYIGKLQVAKWLKENLTILVNKKLFLFLVAGTPPDQKQKLDAYIQAGVPEEIRGRCEIVYLPGRLTINKLSWLDRFMLKMGARLTKDPNDRKTMLTDYDLVKKEQITPLIQKVKDHFEILQPA
jgi:menaquinone-dependent protoporphyrinogen IX oxidase